MPRFQLSKEQFTEVYSALETPHKELGALISLMDEKGSEEVHIFEQEEITKVLSYFTDKPYYRVNEVLNKIFPLHSLPEPEASVASEGAPGEVPVVQAEVVASPAETSLPEQV
jgi:hypothetical protein